MSSVMSDLYERCFIIHWFYNISFTKNGLIYLNYFRVFQKKLKLNKTTDYG